jgi:hypothetical protein
MLRFIMFAWLGLRSLLPALAADPLDQWVWRNPLPTGNALTAITFASGQFVTVGGHGTILTSTEGTHWANQASGITNRLLGVAYEENLFVAVDGTRILTSTDGTRWAGHDTGTDKSLRGVAYGNNTLTVVGVGGVILQSGQLQPKVEPLTITAGGTVQGQVSYLNATHCTIEASANLTDWVLLTNLTTSNASVPFTDASATNCSRRFYRARSTPP